MTDVVESSVVSAKSVTPIQFWLEWVGATALGWMLAPIPAFIIGILPAFFFIFVAIMVGAGSAMMRGDQLPGWEGVLVMGQIADVGFFGAGAAVGASQQFVLRRYQLFSLPPKGFHWLLASIIGVGVGGTVMMNTMIIGGHFLNPNLTRPLGMLLMGSIIGFAQWWAMRPEVSPTIGLGWIAINAVGWLAGWHGWWALFQPDIDVASSLAAIAFGCMGGGVLMGALTGLLMTHIYHQIDTVRYRDR